MNAVIITAKGESKSLPRKNLYPVLDVPCVTYSLAAALGAELIDGMIFCLTDDNVIGAIAQAHGAAIIWEPDELTAPDANHGDAIRYAVNEVADEYPSLANVVVLIGNTVMINAELIDQALLMLDEEPDVDSVMTVWRAQDDHPLRSLALDEEGLLTVYPGREHLTGAGPGLSTGRQSYPPAYYFDQGLWAFRWGCVQERSDAVSPWWWMGKKCRPIVRTWLAGRDIHNLLDVSAAKWWLMEGHKHG